MIVVQVRRSRQTPQPSPSLLPFVYEVADSSGAADWMPHLPAVLTQELQSGSFLEGFIKEWTRFRSQYVWDRPLGPKGSIRAMVETTRHIAELPVYLHILERLAEDKGMVAVHELGAFEAELQMVQQELAAKADYAGWELIGYNDHKNRAGDDRGGEGRGGDEHGGGGSGRPVGYGMYPFENEVLVSRDGWRIVLRRDDKVVAITPEGQEVPIEGWKVVGESPRVELSVVDGGGLVLPSELGMELLIKGRGSQRVEIRRGYLTSVYSLVWVGLNEAVGVAGEEGSPIEIVERGLLEEQRSYYLGKLGTAELCPED